MDYLDPRKQTSQRGLLLAGYVLVAVAIILATRILLLQAYGFGLGKNGSIIQDGLTFFSSQPNPAQISVNGKPKGATNTRLLMPAGIYKINLARTGYYPWQRTIELDGGGVQHFDYPFLIPTKLDSVKLQTYSSAPTLVTQSPDRRWLLVGRPDSITSFELYDLKSQTSAKTATTTINLPANILTQPSTSESWQLAEWADDNQHVLLQHNVDGKSEYVLLDRTNPAQSVNLNNNLSISSAKILLRNKKFDQYYLYDAASGNVQEASLKSTVKTTLLQHVLAFQPYGGNTLLYVTSADAPANKVQVKMLVGTQDTILRSLPTSSGYVLDLTQYSGTMYVAMGAFSTNKVYIYQDPIAQLANQPHQAIVPAQVLHVVQPNHVSFSDNAQFIVTENGTQFGVYDIQNNKGYNYTSADVMDAPQVNANWMDGDRLDYVSDGKVVIFDYDHTNQHVLVSASSQYVPAFAPDYKFIYSLVRNSAGQYDLNQTWLLAPADR